MRMVGFTDHSPSVQVPALGALRERFPAKIGVKCGFLGIGGLFSGQ